MNRLKLQAAGAHGFTLVELVVVIVVMGILAAVAAARFFDRNVMDARTYADQASALIRYGQKTAIAQNREVWVVMSGAGIKLCFTKVCGASDYVAAPGGSNSGSTATKALCANVSAWACEGAPSGVTLGTTINIFFDAVGKPYNEPDSTVTYVSSFVSALTVAVQATGTASRSITVEPETGYVH